MEKLHAYFESTVPAKPAQPARKPSQPTAAGILQLNQIRPAGKQTAISLEMKVDQYLSDLDQGSGIVEYLQVDKNFLIFCFEFINLCIAGTGTLISPHFSNGNGCHTNPGFICLL